MTRNDAAIWLYGFMLHSRPWQDRHARLIELRAHLDTLAEYIDSPVSVFHVDPADDTTQAWQRYERTTGERKPAWGGVGHKTSGGGVH